MLSGKNFPTVFIYELCYYIPMEDKIIVFSDGASKGNPGPGGFGVVIVLPEVKANPNLFQGRVVELGGFDKYTTNNRMELAGVLRALTEVFKRKKEIVVYTDSKYVINGMTGWIYGWQKNNWKTKEKKDVLNKDLWEKLAELVGLNSKNPKTNKNLFGRVKWHYVGGHVGVAGNERCDEIASGLAMGEKVDLYHGPLSKYKINVLDFGHSEKKKEVKSNKNTKAYSYLSLVDGVLHKDKTWMECEKRVKGKKGVKYQKAVSEYHEQEIIRNWGVHD